MQSYLLKIMPPVITSSIFIKPFFPEREEFPQDTLVIFPEEIRSLIPKFLFSFPHFQIQQGTKIKEQRMREGIETFLENQQATKASTLVAIGGGSVLDVVGFVASTYLRGIDYISLPTTLLAMTDAAFGGKTAIDSVQGKNRIGTFYHAKTVFVNLAFLQTLPLHLIIEGCSESIKHALLFDETFFSFIESHIDTLLSKEISFLATLVQRSIALKLQVIKQDPFEKGSIRHTLNLGHTVGHALEFLSNYTLSHGIAVALGLRVEAAISKVAGFLSDGEFRRICHLLNQLYPDSSPLNTLTFESMIRDKKSIQGIPRFTPLRSIGICEKNLYPIDPMLFQQGLSDARSSY
jgi:3-dehydroquinate synthetase